MKKRVLAYNIIKSMKCLVLPVNQYITLHIPAQIITHACSYTVQLSYHNVFDRLFWQVPHRIQQKF